MKRAVLLQIDATARKEEILNEFSKKATAEYNRLWKERDFCPKFMDFHRKVYSTSKSKTSFNVQVICDIERSVWRSKNQSKRGITVKLNAPRNCKTFATKSSFFVELGIYPRRRIAVPVVKNRNFQRYESLISNGWKCKTYGLTPDLQIVAYLSKDDVELPMRANVLGVDVNSKCFAVSILSPEGKILRQLYLGKDIWVKRRRIFERKSVLQGYADTLSKDAGKKLIKAKRDEHNFVKNRIGEVVREITNVALEYDADIAIENLKRFSPKGKRFNREVMRIPFFAFKKNLTQRCFDKRITLNTVDSWHTSKFCSHCGAVGKGHSANYSLFKCKECGQVVNSDRQASKNIAVKSLLERGDSLNQKILRFSNRRVPVNGLIRHSDVVVSQFVAVQHDSQPTNATP